MIPESTRQDAARLLQILQTARTPLTAAELARRLALPGQRETQRRRIRAMIADLRAYGNWIVATLCGGYAVTGNPIIWKDYLEGRKIDAKRILGDAYHAQRMVTDAAGQGLLFAPPR